jgi:hypothetical protein
MQTGNDPILMDPQTQPISIVAANFENISLQNT